MAVPVVMLALVVLIVTSIVAAANMTMTVYDPNFSIVTKDEPAKVADPNAFNVEIT